MFIGKNKGKTTATSFSTRHSSNGGKRLLFNKSINVVKEKIDKNIDSKNTQETKNDNAVDIKQTNVQEPNTNETKVQKEKAKSIIVKAQKNKEEEK